MGKFALINGRRVPLHKAVALDKAKNSEENRLYEESVACLAGLAGLEKQANDYLSKMEQLGKDFVKLPSAKKKGLLERMGNSHLFLDEEGNPDEYLSGLLDKYVESKGGSDEKESVTESDEGDSEESGYDEGVPEVPDSEGDEDNSGAGETVDYGSLEREELKELAEKAGFEVKKNTPNDRLIQWLKTGKGPVKAKKPSL